MGRMHGVHEHRDLIVAHGTRPRPSGPRIARRSAICGSVATATSTNPTPTATPAVHEEDRDLHHDHVFVNKKLT
jgi:hypothetical protein